jgi:putative membrane protein
MLLDLLMRVIVNGIALILAINFVPHVKAPTDLLKLLLLAIVFGLVNAYLRPIVKTLSMPLNLLTLGLVGLILNVALVFVAAFISGSLNLGLKLAGWPPGPIQVDTVVAAFLISLLVGIVAAIVALIRKLTPGI